MILTLFANAIGLELKRILIMEKAPNVQGPSDITVRLRARKADKSLHEQAAAEIERLQSALEKIADWHGAWGAFPETNEQWRAMAIVTAREAVHNTNRMNTHEKD